jgi:hypothetical protein
VEVAADVQQVVEQPRRLISGSAEQDRYGEKRQKDFAEWFHRVRCGTPIIRLGSRESEVRAVTFPGVTVTATVNDAGEQEDFRPFFVSRRDMTGTPWRVLKGALF